MIGGSPPAKNPIQNAAVPSAVTSISAVTTRAPGGASRTSQLRSDARELPRLRPERQLDLLRPEIVAMQRVVDVDADPAVEMLRRIGDAVGGLGRPELRDGDLVPRRPPAREAPHGLPRRQPDRLDVDVGVRGTLVDGLEAR